ncbi:MAG TPA: glycerophosphodiester phosphodiesterase family protein [Kiritimatiellia bacterium]|nr:glycerophosphodiester phosphodiesterase family protein [Kiritimatiellia bacterium]HPS08355.1 glycerophosphodiester phosphodiesterase family protein [Kiritimatiellia bacterium]
MNKLVMALVCAAALAAQGARPVTPEALEKLKHSLIHRGDGKGRPDNTMEALLYTWRKGYSPECDIRYTKDGQIVAFHDNALKGKKIGDWLWKDLREEDVGSYRGAQYAACRPPLWEKIFTAMAEDPSRKIHIDWKDVPPEKVAERVKAHGLAKQCWFITRDYGQIKRYKKALPEGQALHWMNLGNWGRIDFAKPGEVEKCEANLMALFEKAAQENFKDIDNVQLHCQLRYDAAGNATFCPKPETMKTCVERLHAAGVEASMCVWQEEANRPETYLKLWELGFDSFGTDYPEALYKAVKLLKEKSK